jgi:hypothetical protein
MFRWVKASLPMTQMSRLRFLKSQTGSNEAQCNARSSFEKVDVHGVDEF